MLSYRHGFHAGNFADVFKHFLLTYLLKQLKQNKPFSFIDPFAAAGKYSLKDPFMEKNKEYLNGISKVLSSKINDPFIQDYLDLVSQTNPNKHGNKLSIYPGSCFLSLLALDSEDKIYLSELHNNEFEILKNNFDQDKRVTIEKKDAYASLDQMITSYQGTRLVLIDPSYEVKNEYEKVAKLIRHNSKQFPNVCYMVWYPVLESEKTDRFVNQLLDAKINNTTHIHIELNNSFLRMQGTGFFIINAPINMKRDVSNGLDILLEILKDPIQASKINYNVF